MDFGFSKKRWADTQQNYEAWWQKKSDRPIICGTYYDTTKFRNHKGANNCVYQAAFYDESISDDYILDSWEYQLLSNKYFGDSYPVLQTVFSGPGAIASYMGCIPKSNNGGIWFFPSSDLNSDISKNNVILDENNKWYQRTKRFLEAAVERFSDNALISMPDIGGNLDIISSFLEAEKLLIELYDNPEDVKRILWQAHDAWHKCFNDFNKILSKPKLGYTNWSQILSSKPYYILQCDFCYMISTAMFEEFVRDELVKTVDKIDRTIYHLDGIGQAKHLDSILKIKKLGGIQWVPGEGNPPVCEWPEIIKKIIDADKLFYYYGPLEGVESIYKSIGNLNKMYIQITEPITDECIDDVMRRLDKMGISL
jgi:hypothetical protein